MNEKLTVRNFGPIKGAEVEFKRVTVFIGPTGGGKSTLAKLAAIFRDVKIALTNAEEVQKVYGELLLDYQLDKYSQATTTIEWIADYELSAAANVTIRGEKIINHSVGSSATRFGSLDDFLSRSMYGLTEEQRQAQYSLYKETYDNNRKQYYRKLFQDVVYVPAERVFVAAADEAKWELDFAGVTLPRTLVNFARVFERARHIKAGNGPLLDMRLHSIEWPILDGVKYSRQDNGSYVVEGQQGWRLPLVDTSSGLQSGIVLLVALSGQGATNRRHLILEEPELSLYPDKQRKILEHLITYSVDDPLFFNASGNTLLFTTHSPYILSHLNLLLYAHQVAEQYSERAEEVADIVPRASWINPKEFTAYYVGENDVRSIVDADSGLIDSNALDEIAGDQADAFDNLIRLTKRVSPS